ncbi:MAG: S41 family peptidase [Verrucomicrobiota bacterium]
MHKRYLSWTILVGLLAILASQFFARPEWRALLSTSYWSNLGRYGQVMRYVESEYVDGDEVDFKDFTDVALRQAVQSLDKYSDYMPPRDYENFNMASEQTYVGVGIEVGEFAGRISISEVFDGGSAQRSGLLAGDAIIEVDGEGFEDPSLYEVTERIRGEEGTVVRLGIERPKREDLLSFEMERRSISLSSVANAEIIADGIGYLRFRQFTENSAQELAEAIQDLRSDGMEGLVLDLRDNPGGRLDSALQIAEMFLETGDRLLTVQSRRRVMEVFEAGFSQLRFRFPLAIIINGNSASASEILAGILRDHERAILVGEQSFGKGSVQSIYSFRGDYGLKLTSARYLLPKGEAVHGVGVTPTIVIDQPTEQAFELRIQKHHLRFMTPEEFETSFGFPPRVDSQLEAGMQALREQLSTKISRL